MATPLQSTESGNILKLEVFSNKVSESKDLSPGVVICDYFESILDNTVRFSIVIVDSGNEDGSGQTAKAAIYSLQLTGSEKVHLTIEDRNKNRLKFEGDNALYINEVRNIVSSAENVIYTLDLVSREYIANDLLACEVYRRYDGKISDSASSIMKDILKTNKNVIIDETVNTYNFIGQGKKPFTLLAEIGTKGIPTTSSNTAGYLIYETYDGFNFRSIDGLFDAEPYKSYIYNSSTELPSGYNDKIISYDGDNSINVEKNLKSGSYGTKLDTFNTYTHLFGTAKTVGTEEQKPHGGKELPTLGKDFDGFAIEGSFLSMRIFKTNELGSMQSGSVAEQIEKGREENLKLDQVIAQSKMTYNKLFTLDVTVVVPGDYSLRAGDLVHCDFIEQSSKKNTEVDKELSGVYVICDICTHLTSKTTLTKMHLVRDSHGRTANKTTQTSQSNNSGLFSNSSVDPSNLNNSSSNSTTVEQARTIDRTTRSLSPTEIRQGVDRRGTDIRGGNFRGRPS
jgi:hypothetical protein